MGSKSGKQAARALADDDQSRREALANLSGLLTRWGQAVEMQARRIDEATFEVAQREMDLLVLAMRGVMVAAEAASELGVDAGEAIAAFDSAAPEAKEVRDVLAHLPEYILGVGRLQTSPSPPVSMVYARSAAGTAVMMSNPSLTLDVGGAAIAVADLVGSVVEAIHDALEG